MTTTTKIIKAIRKIVAKEIIEEMKERNENVRYNLLGNDYFLRGKANEFGISKMEYTQLYEEITNKIIESIDLDREVDTDD